MPDRPLDRIVRELGVPELVEKLSTLQPSDLESLMLEVCARRAGRQTPARVLEQHRTNRFVRIGDNDPRRVLALELQAFSLLPEGYVPLELSPLAPLGTSSVLATVSQNKVVSTSRNSEVLSDATNVLALVAAVRRRAKVDVVKLAASHRLVRAQALANPQHRAHFRLMRLVAAGRGPDFEVAQLTEHLAYFRRLLAPHGPLQIKVTDLDGATLSTQLEGVVLDPARASGRGYSQRSCFKLYVNGLEVGDGGFTDWTQKLLSDTKERLLVSAVATERLVLL